MNEDCDCGDDTCCCLYPNVTDDFYNYEEEEYYE